jgi:hypothetical protein
MKDEAIYKPPQYFSIKLGYNRNTKKIIPVDGKSKVPSCGMVQVQNMVPYYHIAFLYFSLKS